MIRVSSVNKPSIPCILSMTESDFPRIIENEDGLDDERQLFDWAKSHEVRLKALLAEAGAILFSRLSSDHGCAFRCLCERLFL